ncbi:penicillin acylase family protein [Sphingomonas suaedae]|uniref:Penicillin acylase family protein n=1 Tax=Sphingomonas suaedae TaxID=2599297 RepID=A0A518RGY0_9SPHN|nr:penicillin acylase family protein [Sphingomonas suaedae]QDX26717.1 penicillin acylase family protein [Sphingomonas suaedae]
MKPWMLAGAVGIALAVGGVAEAKRYDATIVRTTHGIPHITAKDWRGAGYGVGYAYAQDNLCMIAEEFATVAGERSLHFGPKESATLGFQTVDNLSSDLFFRSAIDLPALRRGVRSQGRAVLELTQGYVAGYNRYLRDIGTQGVPEACRGKAWVRPITADDVLRLNEKQMLLASSLNFAPAIANAAPPGTQPPTKTSAAMPDPAKFAIASNGWAFGGDVTANGRGMVIGNPHFPWHGPSRFWEMHITVPGKMDTAGVGIAGSPFPTLGFNRDIAWTHTVTAARHFTLYQLTLDPKDPTAYLVDGKSEKMKAQTISVPMPDGAAPVERTLYSTRFGPVIVIPQAMANWTKGMAFTLRDANSGNQRGIGTWLRIATAKTVGEVRAAVGETLGIPWVNTIVADRHGDALHADVTAVPNVSAAKAKACATPLSPVVARVATLLDGSKSACDWDVAPGTPVPGLMPASDQATYLRRDYVANMNDSYWLSNADAPHKMLAPILGEAEKPVSLRTRSGFTETRALIAGGKVDHARAKDMTFANKSHAALLALKPVLALCAGKAEVAEACAALGKWDGRYDLDSRGAWLFDRFWMKAGRLPGIWAVPFDLEDPINTPRDLVTGGETGVKLIAALTAAADEVAKAGIALDARWGDVQYAQRGADRIPVHGGDGELGVLNVQISEPAPGGVTPRHGSSYVQIVGFDENGPVADTILSYSQSPNPASPWYADQTRLYSEKRWVRFPFTPAQIEAAKVGAAVRIAE